VISARPATTRHDIAVTKPAASRSRSKRLDAPAAQARYIALGPAMRSYAIVAREFGVSETTVRKWARRQGWLQAAVAADEATARKLADEAVHDLEAQARRAARVHSLAGRRVEEELDKGDVDFGDALRAYTETDRLLRLFRGEATERIGISPADVAQLSSGYVEIIRVVASIDGPAEERKVVALRMLDELQPALQDVAA
jgi:hypothetical protein